MAEAQRLRFRSSHWDFTLGLRGARLPTEPTRQRSLARSDFFWPANRQGSLPFAAFAVSQYADRWAADSFCCTLSLLAGNDRQYVLHSASLHVSLLARPLLMLGIFLGQNSPSSLSAPTEFLFFANCDGGLGGRPARERGWMGIAGAHLLHRAPAPRQNLIQTHGAQ